MSVLHRLLLDTNLFDVIASLGTGLYVHHIEFTSFPLCRLNRNLPATAPGRDGGKGVVWSVVLRETQKKNLNDMERTEQKRQQKSKAKKKKKKGKTDIRSNHKK